MHQAVLEVCLPLALCLGDLVPLAEDKIIRVPGNETREIEIEALGLSRRQRMGRNFRVP